GGDGLAGRLIHPPFVTQQHLQRETDHLHNSEPDEGRGEKERDRKASRVTPKHDVQHVVLQERDDAERDV
ncbi:hypothetical protein PMAYCL1PPCAC_04933, partial [Pristionchus mayeri]